MFVSKAEQGLMKRGGTVVGEGGLLSRTLIVAQTVIKHNTMCSDHRHVLNNVQMYAMWKNEEPLCEQHRA